MAASTGWPLARSAPIALGMWRWLTLMRNGASAANDLPGISSLRRGLVAGIRWEPDWWMMALLITRYLRDGIPFQSCWVEHSVGRLFAGNVEASPHLGSQSFSAWLAAVLLTLLAIWLSRR